ncbi:hypothetical protein [Flavobacterium sp.]|uniref:hypothetical protein n=1 Tax=Flavobacterium sp. TaxID=239 RepID=UPI00375171BA
MNWSYLFKHWFSTLLIGPIVSQITKYIYEVNPHKIVGLFEVYPISLLFGLFFSAPTYILYALIYYYLAKNTVNLKISKIILISFAVLGVVTTTSIIKGSMMQDIAISYSIASIISGLFFKLNFKVNK